MIEQSFKVRQFIWLTFAGLDTTGVYTWQYTWHSLTVEDVDSTPVAVVAVVGALPGLLVAHAAHLSSVDLLLIIQVGHSHDPSAGLNFWDNIDWKGYKG